MIDFNYTAPELLPLRIQEVLGAPNEPHRIGDVVYLPKGSEECEMVTSGTPCNGNTDKACTSCGAYNIGEYYDGQGHIATPKFCPECGAKVKAVDVLGSQADELRLMARQVREYDYEEISRTLREAADIIENLWDRLSTLGDIGSDIEKRRRYVR